MQPIRVLFIHHYGVFSGSSRSLLELILAFPPGTVEPSVLTPPGTVTEIFSAAGIRCLPCRGMTLFDNTRYGRYRGFRWLLLLRELVRIPSTWIALRRVSRQFPDVDVIHVNEIVMLLATALAARWYRRPTVVHVRAVQHSGRAASFVANVLGQWASTVIAIDETVKRSLPKSLKLPVTVIHNGFAQGPTDTEAIKDMSRRPLVVAMIGNLLRVKGCREFVEAAAICKAQSLSVRFVFVGARGVGRRSATFRSRLLLRLGFAQEIESELRETVARRELTDVVEFQPFTTDLGSIYRSIDLVCFPSHLDAPGRPIFEAAFYGVPSLAAISEPTPDTFVDRQTGLKIQARSPEDIVRAIRYLLDHPGERAALGRNARQLAQKEFDARRNALRVLELYRGLIR